MNATETANAKAHDQWVLVEQLPDQSIRLRGAERGMEYFNFDSRKVGSFIYSNKKTGAEFEVINQNEIETVVPVVGIKDKANNTPTEYYDLEGRRLPSAAQGLCIAKKDNQARIVIMK